MSFTPDTADSSTRQMPRARSPIRSAVRAVLGAIAGLVLFPAAIALLLLILLQLPYFATPAAQIALSAVNPWEGTSATVGSAGGTWLTDLTLRDVRIANPDGSLVVSIDSLGASYDLSGLLDGELRFTAIRIVRPVVISGRTDEGDLELLRPFRSEPDLPSDTSEGLSVLIGRAELLGGGIMIHAVDDSDAVTLDVSNIHLRARDILIGRSIAIVLDTLSSTYRPRPDSPHPVQVGAAGSMSDDLMTVRALTLRSSRSHVRGSGMISLPLDTPFAPVSTRFRLTAAPIAYADLQPFTQSLGPEGAATVEATLTRDSVVCAAAVTGSFHGGGTVNADASVKARPGHPPAVRADVVGTGLNVASFTGRPDTTQHIDLRARLEGAGISPAQFSGRLTADVAAHGLFDSRLLRGRLDADLDRGNARLRTRGKLDALLFEIGGTLGVFSTPPAYDLTVDARIPANRTPARKDLFERLAGLRATITAKGVGFNPLTGTSSATVRADWVDNPDFKSLALESSSSDSTLRIQALATTREGYLRLDGRARGGVRRSLVLNRLEFSKLDLSALIGIQGSMALTGVGSGSVSGEELASLRGELVIRLDSSRIGATRVSRASLDASSTDGSVMLSLDAATSDGTIVLEAAGEPFARRPSFTVREASFEGLDLGGLLLGEQGMTDLNGMLRAGIEADLPPDSGPAVRPLPRAGPARNAGLFGTAEVTLGRSRINRQEITGAEVACELTGQFAAIGLDLRTPGGGALLTGSVELFQEFPDVRLSEGRFMHLDVGALGGIEGVDTDLSGTLSADIRGKSRETATGSAVIEILPSRINHEPLHDAKLIVDLRAGSASVRGYGSMKSGSVSLTGSGRSDGGLLEFIGDLEANLHDLRGLTGDSTRGDSEAHLAVGARGVWGPPEATRIDGRLSAGGAFDDVRVDTVSAVVAMTGRTIDVDALLLRSTVADISGGGRIAVLDTTGGSASDFALKGSLQRLDRLWGITGLAFSSTGTAEFDVTLTGTGRDGTLQARTSVSNLGVGGTLIPSLSARASVRLAPGPDIRTVEGDVAGQDLTLENLVVDSLAASVRTDLTVSDFRAAIALDGGERVAVVGTGERGPGRYVITLDSLLLNLGDRQWAMQHRARLTLHDGVDIDDLDLASGERRMRARGVLRPAGEQDFQIQVDSLAFDRLARQMGRPDLGGVFSFAGLVSGPAENARATGRLTASIHSRGEPVGTVESDVDWARGLMKVTTVVTQPDQSTLTAVVSIPASIPLVEARDGMENAAAGASPGGHEFALKTDGFDLAFVQPFIGSDAVSGVRGLLTADLVLRGERGGVSGSGRLQIDTVFAQANALGVTYSDASLRARLDGAVFTIDTIAVRTGEGSLLASGTISLASPDDPAFDLRLVPDRFVGINRHTLRVVASGNMKVSGTMTRPVIIGDVTVDEANFVIPETVGEGQVESVELTDADYAVLRERFGYRRPAPGKSGSGDSTSVALDVGLKFPRRSWIRKRANPSLSVEIEGDLKVRSMPGEALSLAGTLKPVPGRSYVSQFGRQFEIKSGEIRFSGPPQQFDMNVDSEYKVPARSGTGLSEATIRMAVRRRLERFEFDLSSDPPMDQADILSYLTTGTATTGAFASASSQGNLATSAALEQVVGAIGGLTEDRIPLDIFQIRQDGARGITIVAGNYVTPRTYLGVRYPIILQQTGQDSYYDTGTEFEVEYQSFPWLFWNAKGGSTRLLLLLKSRHVY